MAVKNNAMMISQNASELKSIIGNLHIRMYVCMYVRMHLSMYVCMRAQRKYVCMYASSTSNAINHNKKNSFGTSLNKIWCVYICMYVLFTVQGSFNRICCALNSLAKNHSLSKAPRRQLLISKLTPLQVSLTLIHTLSIGYTYIHIDTYCLGHN